MPRAGSCSHMERDGRLKRADATHHRAAGMRACSRRQRARDDKHAHRREEQRAERACDGGERCACATCMPRSFEEHDDTQPEYHERHRSNA